MKQKKINITLTQTILDFLIRCSLKGVSLKVEFLLFQRDSEIYLFHKNSFSESLTTENKNFCSTSLIISPDGDELSSLLDFNSNQELEGFIWKWDKHKLNTFLNHLKDKEEKISDLFNFFDNYSTIHKGSENYSLSLSSSNSLRFLKTLPQSYEKLDEDFHSLHSRNLLLFGEDNFKRISNSKLGCIGAGGLMNPFIIQASHHGYKNFVIIDPDKLEIHNCNRFLGYKKSHLGKFKVDILNDILQDFSSEIHVEKIPVFFPDTLSIEVLSTCDVLVAGVDNDYSRLQIQILALALGKPYLDLGSGVVLKDNLSLHPQVDERGGQIKLFVPGEACISCMGLNPVTVKDFRATQMDINRGYIQGTELTPPSILSLNSTIASMGIKVLTDFLTDTGTRIRHLKYNEKDFKLFIVSTEKKNLCRVCSDSPTTPI